MSINKKKTGGLISMFNEKKKTVDPLKSLTKISKCNLKYNKDVPDYTCFDKETLYKLVVTYNQVFCNAKSQRCWILKKIPLKDENGKKYSQKELYNMLKQKLTKYKKQYKDESFWFKIKEFKNVLKNKEDLFATKMPTEWCRDIELWRKQHIDAPWLSNFDIDNVLEQYELKYSNFKFLGSNPIDFSNKFLGGVPMCVLDIFSNNKSWLTANTNSNKCSFNPKIYKDKTCYGLVLNTDNHKGSGKHWMGLYFNLDKRVILFFDSACTFPDLHDEVRAFIKDIQNQYKHINFKVKHNTVQHQQSNSECGMYSIYFILSMVDADNTTGYSSIKIFDEYFNNKDKIIEDQLMLDYRFKLFLSKCN